MTDLLKIAGDARLHVEVENSSRIAVTISRRPLTVGRFGKYDDIRGRRCASREKILAVGAFSLKRTVHANVAGTSPDRIGSS